MMYDKLMCDLETFGTPDYVSNAIIPNLALVAFDFTTPLSALPSLFLKLDVAEQKKMNRVAHPKTLDWWKKQSPEAQSFIRPSSEDISLEEAREEIEKFIQNNLDLKEIRFWQRGSIDEIYLRNLMREVGWELPFSYGCVRDVRTFIELLSMTEHQEINKYAVPCDAAVEEATKGQFTNWWDWWDFRKSEAFNDIPVISSLPPHHPLADCYTQIIQMRMAIGVFDIESL